jgi:hypothetical protein
MIFLSLSFFFYIFVPMVMGMVVAVIYCALLGMYTVLQGMSMHVSDDNSPSRGACHNVVVPMKSNHLFMLR